MFQNSIKLYLLVIYIWCIKVALQDDYTLTRQDLLQRGQNIVDDFYQRYSTKEVDLVFVIDRSASVKQSGWLSMLNFVRSLLEHFTVDSENTRVAIVTYSTIANVDINDLAKTNENKCSLLKRVKKILVNKELSGYTATHDALVATKNLLYNSRMSAKKAVFVLTDGRSNIGSPPVRASVEMRSLHWNSTWNYTLFGPQLEIYAFGIERADIAELNSIASPLPNHTFHIPNFTLFEDLARSLHRDKQDEKWEVILDQSQCSPACSEHAYCTCTTKRGDYQCVCKKGYEGNGQICTECSVGYYKHVVTPERCQRCPGNTTTTVTGAKDSGSCKCLPPFHQEQGGHSCHLKHCPELPEIAHGKSFRLPGRIVDEHTGVTASCDNTPGNSCHYTCDEGYRLTGHPGLVCEVNGTWIGDIPECRVINCQRLDYHGEVDEHGIINYINSSTTYSSMIEVSCDTGWRPYGDIVRTCTKHGLWSGTRTWCIESKCIKLPALINGEIVPESCIQTNQMPGQVCQYQCHQGYQLNGEGQLLCQNNGKWNSDMVVNCSDTEAPEIECPNDIRAPITDGNHTVVHWDVEQPKVKDNSGWFEVKVEGLGESPVRLARGYHQITYVAEDAAGNYASCTRGILIIERVIRVTYCPDDINVTDVQGYEQEVTWSNPQFLDNLNQSMPYQCTRQSGSLFSIGAFTVHCSPVEQSDAFCQFTIELQRKKCFKPAPPIHGSLTCMPSPPSFLEICTVQCNNNYDFYDYPQMHYKCGLNGEWDLQYPNQFWPDCSSEHYIGMAMVSGEYEYFYYEGECDDIKDQISAMFRQRLELYAWQLCGSATCTVNEVEVTCGFQSRRKRNVDDFNNDRNMSGSSIANSTNLNYNTSDSFAYLIRNTTINDTDDFLTSDENSSHNATVPETIKYFNIKFKINISTNGNTAVSQRLILHGHRQMTIRLQRHFLRENITVNVNNNGVLTPVEVALQENRSNRLQLMFDTCPSGFVLKTRGFWRTCIACPVGTYYKTENGTETCSKCPIGTYQGREGSLNCTACTVGYSTSEVGAVNITDCLAPCTIGQFSSTGFPPCIPCQTDYYGNNTRSTSCLPCPANTSNTFGCRDTNISVDFCASASHSCENGGICVSGRTNFTCDCLPGFYGDRCEFNINECASSPCNSNSTCVDGQGDFTCLCTTGFTGMLCNIEINECDLDPCENGGSCEDLHHGYRCYCPYTHTGVNCQQELHCSQHPCHHGNCQEIANGYECICDLGFIGENCDLIDMCWTNPCQNSGSCVNRGNDFQCLCLHGHTGRMCELEESTITPCTSSPCYHDGHCEVIDGQFYCKCKPGYGGVNCELEVSADFDLVFKEPGITDYVHLRLGNGDLTTISACMWLRTSDIVNYGTPFSYAAETNYITAEESDMFTLTDYGRLQIYVNGEVAMTTVSVNTGMWNHVCLSWQSLGGKWWLLVNGTVADRGDNLANNAVVPENGYFIIGTSYSGQEQDVVGDGFDSREAFIGEISQLNVYDFVLPLNDVQRLSNQTSCNKSVGNLIAWTDVIGRLQGNVEIREKSHCLDINECRQHGESICPRNKKCKDLIGGYNCSGCVYGYHGDDCSDPINECDFDVCYNNALCTDGPLPNDYECHCTEGYTGTHCESNLNPCEEEPCMNNGTCVLHRDGYACLCTDSDKMDRNCNYLRSPCHINPCQNLGICIIKNNTFECSCQTGFKGRFCDVRIGSCHDNLCQNGGSCFSTSLDTYTCSCLPLWKGRHCEISYTPNCDESPCLNNGTCVAQADGYECQCLDIPGILWGPNCEQNACETFPCQNNGICLNLYDNSYRCVCKEDFTGTNCEWNITVLSLLESTIRSSSTTVKSVISTEDIMMAEDTTTETDLCASVVCGNGGTCYHGNIDTGHVYCQCLPGYTGVYCMELRQAVIKQYEATVLLTLPFHQSYQRGIIFKKDFGKQLSDVYSNTVKDGELQVTDIVVRPGTDQSGTLVSYTFTYTEFKDSKAPPVSMDELKHVVEECLENGYLGRFTVSKRHFEFKVTSDFLIGTKLDMKNGDNSITVYLIITLIVLIAVLLVIGTFIVFRLKRRTSYRKTNKLLHGLNNTSNNALNMISNPVFEDVRDRPSSGEDNYAELGDMLDPYCVTSKIDITDEDSRRRPVSRYSSTRSVRSNKDSNIQRAAARKFSELSDSSCSSTKKLNSLSDSSSIDTTHYLTPLTNRNEFDFSDEVKKDTKEPLPACIMTNKSNQSFDCNICRVDTEKKELKDKLMPCYHGNQNGIFDKGYNKGIKPQNTLQVEMIPDDDTEFDGCFHPDSLTLYVNKKLGDPDSPASYTDCITSGTKANSYTEDILYNPGTRSSYANDIVKHTSYANSNENGLESPTSSANSVKYFPENPTSYANDIVDDSEESWINKTVNPFGPDYGDLSPLKCASDVPNGPDYKGLKDSVLELLPLNKNDGECKFAESSCQLYNNETETGPKLENQGKSLPRNGEVFVNSHSETPNSLKKLDISNKPLPIIPIDVESYKIKQGSKLNKKSEVPPVLNRETDNCKETKQCLPYVNSAENDWEASFNSNISEQDGKSSTDSEVKPYTYDYAKLEDRQRSARKLNTNNRGTRQKSPVNQHYVNDQEPKVRKKKKNYQREDSYVLPDSVEDSKIKKKTESPKTEGGYIDMSGGTALKRGDNSSFDQSKRARHRSADDYLEVLPAEPQDLPSTLPRAAKSKDISKRKLPPLPK